MKQIKIMRTDNLRILPYVATNLTDLLECIIWRVYELQGKQMAFRPVKI